MPTLRLLSVNARTLSPGRGALVELIANARPDLACVHGSPSLLRWRSISAALARRSGLVLVCGGRTGGANLIMSALGVDVLAVREVRFAGASGLHPPGAALAVLRLRGSEFVCAAARLVGDTSERLAQAVEVQEAITGLVPDDPPVMISAEGTGRSGSAPWQALVGNRVALSDAVFVDGRIGFDQAQRRDVVPLSVELALPNS